MVSCWIYCNKINIFVKTGYFLFDIYHINTLMSALKKHKIYAIIGLIFQIFRGDIRKC